MSRRTPKEASKQEKVRLGPLPSGKGVPTSGLRLLPPPPPAHWSACPHGADTPTAEQPDGPGPLAAGTSPGAAGSCPSLTCPDKAQEGQDQEGRAAGKDAQGEAEQRGQENRGPEEEVEERPGPPGRLELLPGEHALLVVHLLQRVLQESSGRAESRRAPSKLKRGSEATGQPAPPAEAHAAGRDPGCSVGSLRKATLVTRHASRESKESVPGTGRGL